MNEYLSPRDQRAIEILEQRKKARIKHNQRMHPVQTRPHSKRIVPAKRPKQRQNLEKRVAHHSSGLAVQKKIRDFWNYLNKTGAMVTPEKEIKLGKIRNVNLNENGVLKYEKAETAYSARLVLGTLTSLLDGTMFYFGPAGCGKTAEISAYSKFVFNIPFKYFNKSVVTCNKHQTFQDVFAYVKFDKLMGSQHREEYAPRMLLKLPIKFVDEIDKSNDAIQNNFLELLANKSINHRNNEFRPPVGPYFFAGNKLATISDFLKDRFDVMVRANSPSPYYSKVITSRPDYGRIIDGINPLTKRDVALAKREIESVELENEAAGRLAFFLAETKYCVYGGRKPEHQIKDNLPDGDKPSSLCSKHSCKFLSDSYICNMTKNAFSVRTYLSIDKYVKGFAWLQGKKTANVNDVKTMLKYVAHKIVPSTHAIDKDPVYNVRPEELIDDMFEESGKAYGRVLAKIPRLGELCSIITRATVYGNKAGIKKADIRAMKKDLKKIEGPRVCGLIVDLDDIESRLS